MLHSLTSTSWFICWNSVQNVMDVDVLNCFFWLIAGLLINFLFLVSCLIYKATFVVGAPKISELNSVL